MIYVTINTKKIFDKEKNYQKNMGKFFLVSSSFTAIDAYVNKKDYAKWIANSVENNLKKKMFKDLRSHFKYDKIYYDRLVKFTKEIAEQNPKINFIFRPHPRQDIKKVKKNFDREGLKNIFIIQQRFDNSLHLCLRVLFTFGVYYRF